MSREIKFRGWHKELKRLLYPPLGLDSMTYARADKPDGPHVKIKIKHMQVGDGLRPFPAHWTWDGRCYINGEYQDIEWQQYTGMKDRDGVEIYEGDIVEWKTDIGEFTSIWKVVQGEVYWDRDRMGFLVKYECEGRSIEVLSYMNGFKVIGHKYEIPKSGVTATKSRRKKARPH